MEQTIREIAHRINEIDSKRKVLASSLGACSDSGIVNLKEKIKEIKLDSNLVVVGVDGGFLKKEYHGAGLILRRAVAVAFKFSKELKLLETNYFPNRRPLPEPVVTGPELSEQEFNLLAGLKREECELQTALAAIEKFSPDVLVRDGSIILYPGNAVGTESKVYGEYQKVIGLFQQLYKTCKEKNILLVGAVEDSRGKRYCGILKKEVLPEIAGYENISKDIKTKIENAKDVLDITTDTLFLYYLLGVGERTAALDYSTTSDLPIITDLADFRKNIYVSYIKAAEFDRPLRLDFFAEPERLQETADKIVSVIFALSNQNRLYSYPSVLIEADARAKLSEDEIDYFKAAISEKLGRNPALFELRRELRPF
ncbi:MAG: DNA double-strand break repair nuclease NurA [DPANN group archaeon]|nr:DNA double-strand break repair nuclease NurA [DPANN group archaeon]